MTISNNSYPLNVLSTLGISVKPQEGKASLPKDLGNYLDKIIQADDLASLFQAAPQVINSAAEIAVQDPRVALNALLAMNKSTDLMGEQVGLSSFAGEEGAKKADPRLLKMHHDQKNLYTKIAGQVGISDNGLSLDIIQRDDLNQFLKNLADKGVELTQADKEFFHELLRDDLFTLLASIDEDVQDKNTDKLFAQAETIRLISRELGVENLPRSSDGQEIPLNGLHRGICAVALDVQDGRNSTMLEPLKAILVHVE